MPDDRIAEWLLAAATTRERGVSILGDLRESAATRGELWFWASVLGTTASLSWRGLVEDPRGMLGLAFRGMLVSLLIQVGFVASSVIAVFVVAELHSHNSSVGFGWSPPFWPMVAAGLFADFFVGRWMARRAPGRALSACLALAILLFALMLMMLAVPGTKGWAGALGGTLLSTLTCFLGALSVRRGTTHA